MRTRKLSTPHATPRLPTLPTLPTLRASSSRADPHVPRESKPARHSTHVSVAALTVPWPDWVADTATSRPARQVGGAARRPTPSFVLPKPACGSAAGATASTGLPAQWPPRLPSHGALGNR